ncbi:MULTISPECIES: tRNA pseudouridine(55) synthase TruB [unclassified Treponema]|uniref:tRNA pseudouridine(55) synthase TruB n=1 Tax=unclassified Treponema TaxID=2638727 RepID=UPI0005300CF0|nr:MULTISPECIES: tRNA pseudouridine(55) synthase TruB [unclassified Treponema]AIW89916.1 tRNA pseudouridine synthase [Treponema sp. OMZ 838]UTC50101.1 tRNA pseudouridine(55) synthase TruB [Treponema sp. OMZ 855]
MPKSEPQFIIPFAKPSGITSFTSLWQVKHALGTKKVGHTGTLDSFADGLLVLLSGKLTKLVPYITDFDKTYRVLFYFGKETDTLDPEGTVIAEKPLPVYADFVAAIKQLTGTIEQVPPVYSAVKQAGERLSDKIRRGETVTVPPRTVTIYNIDIEEIFYAPKVDTDAEKSEAGAAQKVLGAVLCVRCSKGTYIRSLVRDIAHRCGSAAYVYALRRTAVGPFTLEQAACFSALQPFGSAAVSTEGAPYSVTEEEIKRAALPLNEEIAGAMHFQIAVLQEKYYAAFMNGKPINGHWFTGTQPLSDGGTIAVFYEKRCVGLIIKNGNRFHYQIVFNRGTVNASDA